VVFSIPKSGRTWLRVLIQAYRTGGLPERFRWKGGGQSLPPPAVYFTHERWTHRTTRSLKELLVRLPLVPADLLRHKPVMLLARDPRDVIVSLYFAETRRQPRLTAGWRRQQWPLFRVLDAAFRRLSGRGFFAGTMSDFIRSPRFGIRAIVDTMNEWLRQLSAFPQFRLLRYEDLRADTAGQLREALRFMGVAPLDEEALARAVAFASFENMRRLEASGRFPESLRAADPADPDSFKVRRGKIGGYQDYLSSADIACLEAEIARLDRRFGYDRPAAVAHSTGRYEETPAG
jgi:hypothetical protein